jgi:hypothetical protein
MKNTIYMLLISMALVSCKAKMEDDVSVGPPPNVDFKIEKKADPNRVVITNTSSGIFQHKFDFANGETSTGDSYTGYYPFTGDYLITLVGSGKGGTVTTVKTLSIPSNDPKVCTDTNAVKLSGGCDSIKGYTWVMSRDSFATGVGPIQPYQPGNDKSNMAYYHVKKDSAAACQYATEIVFQLRGGVFLNNNHGQSMYAWNIANSEKGLSRGSYQDICLDYTPPKSNWKIGLNAKGVLTLSITNGGFILYKEGVSEYEVLVLDKNNLILRYSYTDLVSGGNNYRYFKLKRKFK